MLSAKQFHIEYLTSSSSSDEEELNIIKEYQELNNKCDNVIIKINKRKKLLKTLSNNAK